ncbi:hypothetical protein D3C71_2106830 [compost metagenome]
MDRISKRRFCPATAFIGRQLRRPVIEAGPVEHEREIAAFQQPIGDLLGVEQELPILLVNLQAC